MSRPEEVLPLTLSSEQQSNVPIVHALQLRQYLDLAARRGDPASIPRHIVAPIQLDMLGVMLCERLTHREQNRNGSNPKEYADSVYLIIAECRAGIDSMSDRPLPPELLGVPVTELPLEILGITDDDIPCDIIDLAEDTLSPEILGLQTDRQFDAITTELLVDLPSRAFGSEFAKQVGRYAAHAYDFTLEPAKQVL